MRFINLKKFRQDYNLKQKDISRTTGLNPSVLSFLANGYQVLTDKYLMILEEAYPWADFSAYIYEYDSYPIGIVTADMDSVANRTFAGDWNQLTPLDNVFGLDILLHMRRVHVTTDGHILIDRNDGTYENLGYYTISPERLSDPTLLYSLTQKEWFNDSVYEDFKRCYYIACHITGMPTTIQTTKD